MNCKVCQNLSVKNPSLSFFRFPSDYYRCREWAKRCSMLNIFEKHGPGKFYRSFRICSDHFESKYIEFDGKKKKLLKSAVPKVFPKSDGSKSTIRDPKESITSSGSDVNFTSTLLKNLCRFCAEKNTQLVDIYSYRGKMLKLEEKIKVFPITIHKQDRLPLKICSECIFKISKFYNFVKKCFRADARLKALLGVIRPRALGNEFTVRGQLHLGDIEHTKQEGSTLHPESKIIYENNRDQENYSTNFMNGSVQECQKPDILHSNFLDLLGNVPPQLNLSQVQDVNYERFLLDKDGKTNTTDSAEFVPSSRQQDCSHKNWLPENLDNIPAPAQKYENSITKSYTCNKCFKNFCNPEILESHEKAHSLQPDEQGKFTCQTCNKEFPNKYRLNEHNRVHTGEYPFKCSICNKKFHKMALLRQHSMVHESRKPFFCSICNLRSSRKGNLMQHLKTHYKILKNKNSTAKANNLQYSIPDDTTGHNEKRLLPESFIVKSDVMEKYPTAGTSTNGNDSRFKLKFICGLCGTEIFDPESLEAHFKIHASEHSKSCHHQIKLKMRGHHSGQKTALECIKTNLKRKKNERSYCCEECGVTFKRKDTLKNHSRIHTGERPFVCKTCGFAFKQRGDCLKHERNHKRNDELGQNCAKFQINSAT